MLRPILVMIWLGWSLQTVSSQTNTQAVTTATPAVYGCSPPQPPVNGLVRESWGIHMAVEFFCDGGYFRNGNGTAVCDPVLGEWSPANPPKCEQRTACPPPVTPVNGFTWGYDTSAAFYCIGGYSINGSGTANCDVEQGVWDLPPPTCEPSPYCPLPEQLLNGFTSGYKDAGTGEWTVLHQCYGGYVRNGPRRWTFCDPNVGVWDPQPPRCELAFWNRVDCSPPEQPPNGFAVEAGQDPRTVQFGCNDGYTLNGSAYATCDALLKVWDPPSPLCELLKAPTIAPCPSVLDDLGIVWQKTTPGTQAVVDCIHLQDDLAGVISRNCSSEGGWRTPLYNCIRETLATVLDEIEQLLENPTNSSVEVALSKLANATSETDSLFEGEIKPIVELLETIVDYVDATSSVTETEDFFSITDDLLGRVNEPAWARLIETPGEQEGGFVVLRVIEQFAENLVDDLAEGENKTLAGDNVELQLVKLHGHSDDNDDILFPLENGLATSDSYLYLPKTSLVGSTAYITATYKQLTGIIPEPYQGVHTGDLELNSVVLTLTLLPNSQTALHDPVRLTYEHLESDKSDPTCSFWDYNSFFSSMGKRKSRKPGHYCRANAEASPGRFGGLLIGKGDGKDKMFPIDAPLCLIGRLDMISLIGKKGRDVAAILTPEMKRALDILVTSRATVGIDALNRYLFPRSTGDGHIEGHVCLSKLAYDADLKYPERIGSTKLRKYIATVVQMLNLEHGELEWLSNHLGHTIDVHKEFYRNQEGAVQLGKVAKMLIAVDQGRILDNQTDENDEDDDVSGEASAKKSSESNASLDVPLPKSNYASGRVKVNVKRWTQEEIAALKRQFDYSQLKPPNQASCLNAISNEPALVNRTWKHVKFRVWHEVRSLKKKMNL